MKTPRTFFRTLILLTLLMAGGNIAVAQEDITLRLRTMLNYYPVACDSIEVQNTTQGTSTTLYYPDTILTNSYVGIEEFVREKGSMELTLLSANPFSESAEVLLSLPVSGQVEMSLTNMLGQQEYHRILNLNEGKHRLLVRIRCNGLHVLSARTSTDRSSAKLIQNGNGTGKTSIEYLGIENGKQPIKRILPTRSQFDFSVGDRLSMTTHANAHYYDTVIPIHQTVGFTVSESGTVNFKAFYEFEEDSILHGESVDLRNTMWSAVASMVTGFCECLTDFATDMGEEVESQVTFYDSTFCSVQRAGPCNASYIDYEDSQYPIQGPWIYNNYSVFNGKYRLEYDTIPEYNVIVTNLYVGPLDSLCCELTYHYKIHFFNDYNILWVGDETRGMGGTWEYYLFYFRREGRVE